MDLMDTAQLLGSFGEFFGAIAVVATLGYLVIQVRQNTKSTNSYNNHSVMGAFNSFNETLFSDPDLVRNYYEGMAAPGALPVDERNQFIHMAACVMNIYRNLYYQYIDGTFPEDQWLVQAREAKQLMGTPGIAHFRSATSSYNVLFDYLANLPQDELRPLSEELFPRSA